MADDPNQLHEPVGYVCPKCKAESYASWRPFCAACGRLLPSESEMQAAGLTIYPYQYGKPVRDVDQVAMILHDIGETNYWLEEYHPTFRTTKIRVARNARQESDHDLICTSTFRLEIPIDDGWRGVLNIDQVDGGAIRLHDQPNNVMVLAGSVAIHSVRRW